MSEDAHQALPGAPFLFPQSAGLYRKENSRVWDSILPKQTAAPSQRVCELFEGSGPAFVGRSKQSAKPISAAVLP